MSLLYLLVDWSTVGTTSGIIAGAIATILGALATFLRKVKGKNLKEILSNITKEELDVIKTVVQQQTQIIKDAVHHKNDQIQEIKEDVQEIKENIINQEPQDLNS